MEIEAIVIDEGAACAKVWEEYNDELDSAVSLLHAHIGRGECKVPWCTGGDFEEAMEETDVDGLRVLLHIAIYRLAKIECTQAAARGGDSAPSEVG